MNLIKKFCEFRHRFLKTFIFHHPIQHVLLLAWFSNGTLVWKLFSPEAAFSPVAIPISCQFHQHAYDKLLSAKSQKRKKTQMTWLSFCAFGFWTCKSCFFVKQGVNFHQHFDANWKCAIKHQLTQEMPFSFINKSVLNLTCTIKQLEVTPNLHPAGNILWTRKISINLLVQNLVIIWWWNWPQHYLYQSQSPSRSINLCILLSFF